MSFNCFVNSITRAAGEGEHNQEPADGVKKLDWNVNGSLTLHIESSRCDRRAGREGVLGTVSKVNIPDVQCVSQLFAASLVSVCGPDLHTILQPFVGNLLIVDIDLKADHVFLLSMQIPERLCDDNGCRRTRLVVSLVNLEKVMP